MKLFLLTTILNIVFLLEIGLSANKLKIVTTLPDLAYIAEEIGGDKVEVFAIARGYQDPHFVDAKPSFVLKLKDADMFVQVGLDLEVGWVPPLLETSRNRDINYGGKGYVDASQGIDLLQIPQTASGDLRAHGDIHIFGNPHYWLDPRNGKQIAQNIYNKMIVLRPEQAAYFERNLHDFSMRIDSAVQEWQNKLSPYKGAPIIAYHNSWPYFEERFGLKVIAFIEPKPGIPPTPPHLTQVIKTMQEEKMKLIFVEPYLNWRTAETVARQTGATAVLVAQFPGGVKGTKGGYIPLLDHLVNTVAKGLETP